MGWCIIRGAWFFDYLTAILEAIHERRDLEMSEVAIYAYDVALARHHPWYLQQGAKIGMRFAASRKTFMANLCKEQSKVTGKAYTEDMAYDDVLFC